MKLLTYAINKKELTGVLNREGTFVYPLSAAGMEYRTMKEVIRDRTVGTGAPGPYFRASSL